MVGIETRAGDPGASLARKRSNIEDVVEVPMGDDDATNGVTLPTAPAKRPMQQEAAADESAIEYVQTGGVPQDVEVERRRPDLENVSVQGVSMGLANRRSQFPSRALTSDWTQDQRRSNDARISFLIGASSNGVKALPGAGDRRANM